MSRSVFFLFLATIFWLGAVSIACADDQQNAAPATPPIQTPLAQTVADPNQPNASGFNSIGAPDIAKTPAAPPAKHGASTGPADNRVVLNADKVTYDDDLNIVTARGHVQLLQGSQC